LSLSVLFFLSFLRQFFFLFLSVLISLLTHPNKKSKLTTPMPITYSTNNSTRSVSFFPCFFSLLLALSISIFVVL
jgi:hypothetical protein